LALALACFFKLRCKKCQHSQTHLTQFRMVEKKVIYSHQRHRQ
jgi:hypothetical protein